MKYLIIGDGKVAMHFKHYLSLLNIDVYQWHYKNHQQDLEQCLFQLGYDKNPINSDLIILLLIKDDAINNFISSHSFLLKFKIVIFSGSLMLKNIITTHPLMTFSNNSYDIDNYKQIPFITTHTTEPKNLLPGLPNKIYQIPADLLGYYHSLCVISGNFSQILWGKFSKELKETFNLPEDIINPYIKQLVHNFCSNGIDALTGPLQRQDHKTIQNNLKSLENKKDDYYNIYQEFCKLYQEKPSHHS